MSIRDDIKALNTGSVVGFTTADEGEVAFLKGVVFAGDDPQTAEEVGIWVAPNMMTFDDEAFTGEDAPEADLRIIYSAEATA